MYQPDTGANPDLESFNIVAGGTTIHIQNVTWTGGGTIYFWVDKVSGPGQPNLFGDTGGFPSPVSGIQIPGAMAGAIYRLYWYWEDMEEDDPLWIDTEVQWFQPSKDDPPYADEWSGDE